MISRFYFFIVLIFGLLLFSSGLYAFQNDCFVPLNGCDADSNIIEPKYCYYGIDTNAYTANYDIISIEVIQGGMANSDRDFKLIIDENVNDKNFSVWVDKHTQPTYLICNRVDIDGSKHTIEQITLGNDNVNLTTKKKYYTYDTDSNQTVFLGAMLVIISLFSMMAMAFERRK